MFCPSKADIRGRDCAAVASSRGVSNTSRLDNAQEVFDRFYGPNSVIFGLEAEESAANRGLLRTPNAENDQNGSAKS